MLPRVYTAIFFSAAALLGASAQARCQFSSNVQRPGQTVQNTAGTALPKRAVLPEVAAQAAATATPVTGTFVAKFTIKLTTPLPSGGSVLCQLTATTEDENTATYTFTNQIYETAAAKATVSGSTATCTTTLPYSWYLTYTSTDKVELTYALTLLGATASTDNAVRTSSQYVPGAGAIAVPSSGATTTYSISATL